MSEVWKNSQASHGPLLVLLAIADFADDDGRAYPSIATLCRKARLSERAVQGAIRELGDLNELAVIAGEGRNGTNLYRVQNLHPAEIAPPQKTTDTPAEIAPKPSGTVSNKKEGKLPTSDAALRIAALFGRRKTTEWMPKEIAAFKKLQKLQPFDIDDLALVETYYAFERQKNGDGIHRRDLQTFLNNYYSELDRARAWRENPKANEKKPSHRNIRTATASAQNAGTCNESGVHQYR